MKIRDYYAGVLRRSLGAWRRRPMPGPFALGVLHALRAEVVEVPGKSVPLRVQVDRFEPSDNPFREEFSIRFRLTSTTPQWEPEAVEISVGPIGVTEYVDSRDSLGGAAVGGETYYFFRFRKAWGLSGGVDRFQKFVRESIDGEGPSDLGPVEFAGRRRRSSIRGGHLSVKAPRRGRRRRP